MAHDHSHHHAHQSEKNLRTAFFLNLIFAIIEIVGGLYVNSVAILSDAIHDLGDSLSLGTAWYLERKSKKQANENYNYGYRRFSVLGALINGIILIIGGIYIIREAIDRIQNPEMADAKGMIVLAVLGIIINGWAYYKLESGSSLNEKVVSLHLLEDILGWVAVLIVAIILLFVDAPILDPLLSLAITTYILIGTFKRLKETIYILMQGRPKDIEYSELKSNIESLAEIEKIEELHIWTIDGEHHVISLKAKLHSNLADKNSYSSVKEKILSLINSEHFEVTTIELS